MAAKSPTVSDTLRHALRESPVSRYAIAKETGISNATLCRLLQGEHVKSETVDKLASYFGLVLSPTPKVTRLSA